MKELLLLGFCAFLALAGIARDTSSPSMGFEKIGSVKTTECVDCSRNVVSKHKSLKNAQSVLMIESVGKREFSGSKIVSNGLITDPGVPTEDWMMSAYVRDAFSFTYTGGMPVKYARVGNEIFLLDVVPGNYMQGFIKGTVAEDGKTVTFPQEQLVYIMGDSEEDPDAYKFYFVANKCTVSEDNELIYDAEKDEEGNLVFNWCDAVGEICEDGSIRFSNYMLAIWSFDMDGFVSYVFDPEMNGVEGKVTVQPDNFENYTDYALYYRSEAYNSEPAKLCNVGFKEEDGKRYVYINNMNLQSPESYIRGELSGNVVSFKSQYILNEKSNFYIETYPANNFRTEEVWNEEYDNYYTVLKFDETETVEMEIDSEAGTITMAEGYGLCEYSFADSSIADIRTGLTYKKYAGDKPAVPSAPYQLEANGYEDEDGNFVVSAFGFSLWNKDVDGNYINPDLLGWQVLKDGEVYTFDTDFYWEMPESRTVIPYGYSDYDFLFWGDYGAIAMTWPKYDTFTEWGVRAVYTVDGITNYSEVLSTDIRTLDVEELDIESRHLSETLYYNVSGMESDHPFLNTVNIVKRIYSDGTCIIEKKVFK